MGGIPNRVAAVPAHSRRALPARTRVSLHSMLALGLFVCGAVAAPADRSGGGRSTATEGGAVAAAETRHRSVLEGVAGLDKPVTYTETKIPLGELVARVAADTGATLTASADVADEPVAVVVKDMPAQELLEQVADLLDYTWSRRTGVVRSAYSVSGKGGPTPLSNTQYATRNTHYEIWQDLASKQREEALREAWLKEAIRRFRERLKIYIEIAALPPDQLQQLGQTADRYWQERQKLPPEQQAAALADPEARKQQDRFAAALALQAPVARALAALLGPVSSGQWDRLMETGELTYSSDPQAGELRLPPEAERALREARPTWLPPGARLAFPDPNEEERMRRRDQGLQSAWAAASGYRVSVRLETGQLETHGWLSLALNAVPFRNGEPLGADIPPVSAFAMSGTSLGIAAAGNPALPPSDVDSPGRRAALEKDPVLGARRAFKPAAKPAGHGAGPAAPAWWHLWDLLPELARTYDVDFIADSYWSHSPSLPAGEIPAEAAPLYALLDRAAGETHHWARQGRLIRLRSRTWFFDRPREVPLRYVRRWKAQAARQGALTLDDYLELATALSDARIEGLSEVVRQAGLPDDFNFVDPARDLLRLYASLPPPQRETLQQGGLIPLSRMTPRQQALFMATLKGPVGARSDALTPEQLAAAGLSLKRVPMIRTIDRRNGDASVSDAPAAAPAPAGPAPGAVERVPVTQLQFRLASRQEDWGDVTLDIAEGGARPL